MSTNLWGRPLPVAESSGVSSRRTKMRTLIAPGRRKRLDTHTSRVKVLVEVADSGPSGHLAETMVNPWGRTVEVARYRLDESERRLLGVLAESMDAFTPTYAETLAKQYAGLLRDEVVEEGGGQAEYLIRLYEHAHMLADQ